MAVLQDSGLMESFGRKKETQTLVALMFFLRKVALGLFMPMMSILAV